ncbi:MAG: hypothetical protein JRI44_13155 [Deltaproteobacteria bacterium]|nr:hypothetical protein [Deltaproteobacteria bacterium]
MELKLNKKQIKAVKEVIKFAKKDGKENLDHLLLRDNILFATDCKIAVCYKAETAIFDNNLPEEGRFILADKNLLVSIENENRVPDIKRLIDFNTLNMTTDSIYIGEHTIDFVLLEVSHQLFKESIFINFIKYRNVIFNTFNDEYVKVSYSSKRNSTIVIHNKDFSTYILIAKAIDIDKYPFHNRRTNNE